MDYTPEQLNLAKWTRGALKFLLKPHQIPIYDALWECINDPDPNHPSHVINCARQFGKSFTEMVVAVEFCIRNPRTTVTFVAPLKNQAAEIVTGNTFYAIFQTCPDDLRPKIDGTTIIWPNSSRIRLGGTDNRNYENLRGGATHLLILDEAGFMSNLDTGVLPALQPMLDSTGGKTIFSSTPPDTPDHPYTDIYRDHAERGHSSTFTIFDNTSKTTLDLQKVFVETGSTSTAFSTRFRREYLCQFVTEETRIIARDWNAAMKGTLDKDQYYEMYHKYVSIDPGVEDLTAVLFGYYDYSQAILQIEGEYHINGHELNTLILSENIKVKMKQMWGEQFTLPYRLIADNNNKHLIQDLGTLYGLPFFGTSKTRLENTNDQQQEGMVNTMNRWFAEGRIRIDPSCTMLLGNVENGVWGNRTGTTRKFARSTKFGHYDHLAALIYMIRNIDIHTNPVPTLHHFNTQKMFNHPDEQNIEQRRQHFKLAQSMLKKR